MEHDKSFPPADGRNLRQRREDAGVTQDEVAAEFIPPTTRQRLRRWEGNPALPYVDGKAYEAALEVAVAKRLARSTPAPAPAEAVA